MFPVMMNSKCHIKKVSYYFDQVRGTFHNYIKQLLYDKFATIKAMFGRLIKKLAASAS